MTRFTKNTLYAVLGLSVAFVGATDALACGRSGGGFRGGYGGGFRGGFGGYPQQSIYRQPYRQPYRPVQQQPVTPVAQQPVQQQPVQQQPVAQQSIQQQPVTQQPVQTAQTQPQPAPAQTQTTPAPAQTTPVQTQTPAAQQTALDILSSFGGVDATPVNTTTPQPQPQAFNGIGTWSATLSNGATIRLELRADNTFTWTAVKDGKQSTFSGTFNMNGQSLTLNRNDNQKLSGSLLSPGTNGFTFKLNGVKDNGLQFARS